MAVVASPAVPVRLGAGVPASALSATPQRTESAVVASLREYPRVASRAFARRPRALTKRHPQSLSRRYAVRTRAAGDNEPKSNPESADSAAPASSRPSKADVPLADPVAADETAQQLQAVKQQQQQEASERSFPAAAAVA
ncbi:hypothetical protein CLOP_g17068 [Closterium sp. NIES-67]|nr:hypothetical protein CLOP_g17068 [Closterium sp. NIES-67]